MENALIKARGLNFKYVESTEGIHDVDFCVNEGEVVLLTGNSGSGKSTLLKCLNGIIPTITEGELSGDLSIGEKNFKDLKMFRLNQFIGSVFQNPRSQFFTDDTTAELVFPMENYGYTKAQMDERLEQLKETFGISKLLNKNVYTLSSGERQLIALASAVTMDQNILLFDEPSANLDYKNACRLGEILRSLKKKGYTAIVADHRFYYLSGVIDKVLFMENGELSIYNSEEEFRKAKYNTRSFDIFLADIPLQKHKEKEREVARLENVSYQNILKDITFSINKGEIVALLGNNGAGKTTLAKVLCKSIKQDSGTAKTEKLPFFIMQDPDYQLFGTSVYNELELVNNDPKRINECLKYLGLDKYKYKHPFDLSGGQKQRLQIAMAILCDRDLIIFDEPTSGLDVDSMKNVSDEITKLKEKSGILVISHDYEFIRRVADRIIYLKDGVLKSDFNLDKDTLSDLNNIFINMKEEKKDENVEN